MFETNVQKTMRLGEINGPRGNPSEALRGASMSEKRKQGLKKRLLDPEQDSDDEEIRYLAKLKSKRVPRDHINVEDKHDVTERDKLSMEGSTSGHIPTTRTRALQSVKDPYSSNGSGPLEFPDGLPCPSSKSEFHIFLV